MIKTLQKITDFDKEDIINFLSTSLYGCDWIEVDFDRSYMDNDDDCIEAVMASNLLKDHFITFVDTYEDKEYLINLDQFISGLNKCFEVCPRNIANVINQSDDYFDANNCLQVILFGDVIYG